MNYFILYYISNTTDVILVVQTIKHPKEIQHRGAKDCQNGGLEMKETSTFATYGELVGPPLETPCGQGKTNTQAVISPTHLWVWDYLVA